MPQPARRPRRDHMTNPTRLALLEYENEQTRDRIADLDKQLDALNTKLGGIATAVATLGARLGVYATLGATVGGALVAAITAAVVRLFWS